MSQCVEIYKAREQLLGLKWSNRLGTPKPLGACHGAREDLLAKGNAPPPPPEVDHLKPIICPRVLFMFAYLHIFLKKSTHSFYLFDSKLIR